MLTRWAHRHAQWLFPAPAVLLVAVLIVYPIAYTGWMSFQEWSASSLSPPRFVGAANYTKILVGDARFREAVARTIYFTLVAVAAETLLGVAMALLFNREFWGRGLLRTLAILPMVATPTAIALVFVMMYHPTLGVANYLLSVAGLSPFRWTYSSETALYALALLPSKLNPFHDIADGSNNSVPDGQGGTIDGFNATKGYDMATGLGSPNIGAIAKR